MNAPAPKPESHLQGAEDVASAFADAARQWPERPFLNVLTETAEHYRITQGELCYAAAQAEIEALAKAYARAGYRAGSRVMLLMENRPGFFLHWFALNALGLSVVPVNPDLRAAELCFLIGHAEPALAIAVDARVPDLEAAARAAGHAMPVVAIGDALPPATVTKPVFDASRPGPEREAAMLYTSGTTGQPKGCVLPNAYFLLAGHWYASTGGLCALEDNNERMLTPLPVFHMNAMAYSVMAMIAVGGCLTVLDRFHPRTWWASVRDSSATCLHYLGVMPAILMQAEANDLDRAHSVRFGFGAGVDPRLQEPFEERFGFPLVEAWAMTETGAGAVLAANREPRKPGRRCIGRPEGHVEVRIVDGSGADVARGAPGELLVRRAGDDPRHGFFSEYYKDPESTMAAWAGGWFHTGDIVCADEDGDLFFVDRQKNVIRRSGENIAAVEVESVLLRHPGVASVGVTAVPDPVRGDEVFACIVPVRQADAELASEIVEWCLGQLAYYKAPGYVAFVDQLPLTPTQKIQRGELKQMAAALLSAPQTVNTCAMKRRMAA